jgi:hypothetical protein
MTIIIGINRGVYILRESPEVSSFAVIMGMARGDCIVIIMCMTIVVFITSIVSMGL